MAQRSTHERRLEILELTAESGVSNVEALAEHLGVSPSTIRRDLAKLDDEGRLARTYGGAIAFSSHPESSIRQRSTEHYAAKDAIGRWAASQVGQGETILLDGGSTTAAVARALASTRDITVVTAGLSALHELIDAPGIELISLGGRLRALSQSFVGPLAEVALERMSFDRVFMGTDGVTADRGLCEATVEQTRLKELIMQRSANVYVLAHGEKVGCRPFHAWAMPPASWTLVTDATADAQELEVFRSRGIDVVVAPQPE